MKYNLVNVDICNSQYFSGSHLPVVQVLVDENTTYQQVKDSLLDYQNYEHLFDDVRFGNEDISSDLGFDGDTYKQAVEDLFSNFETLDYVPDSFYDIGSFEDNEEHDVYMYFVVETIEGEE
jgi:hypothetical protein